MATTFLDLIGHFGNRGLARELTAINHAQGRKGVGEQAIAHAARGRTRPNDKILRACAELVRRNPALFDGPWDREASVIAWDRARVKWLAEVDRRDAEMEEGQP